MAAKLRREMPRCLSAQERWAEIKKALANAGPSGSSTVSRTPGGKKGKVCMYERVWLDG